MTFHDFLSSIGIPSVPTFWSIILFLTSIGIEVIPQIKWKPWSSLIIWVGSRFNEKLNQKIDAKVDALDEKLAKKDQELSNKIDQIEGKVDIVHDTLRKHIEESEIKNLQDTRRDIQNFSNSCSNRIPHTKEEYDFYIHKCDEYETYIKTNHVKNGVIESAIKNIRRMYDQCIAENGFLNEHGNDDTKSK